MWRDFHPSVPPGYPCDILDQLDEIVLIIESIRSRVRIDEMVRRKEKEAP